jgi:IS5 family transposase
LSDEETEYQRLDRISFRKFAGIGLEQAIPDRNTIGKLKERLASEGMEDVFGAFNRVLEASGLSASKGKTVDVTMVEVPQDWMAKEAEAKVRHKGLDARWTRKHGRDSYAYKNHVKVHAKTKLTS